jgi:hypothetical protein
MTISRYDPFGYGIVEVNANLKAVTASWRPSTGAKEYLRTGAGVVIVSVAAARSASVIYAFT